MKKFPFRSNFGFDLNVFRKPRTSIHYSDVKVPGRVPSTFRKTQHPGNPSGLNRRSPELAYSLVCQRMSLGRR